MRKVERNALLLKEMGWTEIDGRSRKYRTFRMPASRRKALEKEPGPGGTTKEYFYFLGKMGGVRWGRTASNSSSATESFERLWRERRRDLDDRDWAKRLGRR